MAETPLQQARNFWEKLTRVQKITIAGVVTLALAGIVAVVAGSNTPAMGVLFSDVDQKDASAIVEKLRERKIEYELTKNGTTILVPTEVLYETRLALAGEGLPQSSTVGYEIFRVRHSVALDVRPLRVLRIRPPVIAFGKEIV